MPKAGPTGTAMQQNAMRFVPDEAPIDYILVDLSKSVALGSGSDPTAASIRGIGGSIGTPPATPQIRLNVGDIVQVTMFEAESGGLFIPSDAGARASNHITLPNQQVSSQGTITVPYAGVINVAGRTIQAVQEDIRNKVEDRAIEPQVMVTLVSSPSSQVSVLGDVADPALVTIEPSGTRVLDLIARAGGVKGKGEDAVVTLLRGGQSRSFKLASLLTNASNNAYVRPGDTIYVQSDTRSYVVLGALTENGTYRFDGENVTLAQAIGKAGGLIDTRANPGYVYLYREVDRATLIKLGIDQTEIPGAKVPVVFHANLNEPASLFAANRFEMHNGDVLYVSNAQGYEVAKVIQLLYMIADTASKAVYAGNGIGTN